MGIFNELLTIKAFREDKAELAVRKQRRTLAEAAAAREQAEKALADFRDYAQRHEHDLYADLCRRIVRLRDLEDAQLEVVGLRTRERGYEDALEMSEKARAAEQLRLREVMDEHQHASRMRQKFAELAQIYDTERAREREQREDAEMEEVAELSRDRTEWDEAHGEVA